LKRVLIIAYYWPPSAGSGVQRWLKFVKYLPKFGWQPVVYTPDSPDFDVTDESLLKDVPKEAEIIKTKIWEPYSIHKKFFGNGKTAKGATAGIVEESKSSLKAKLSNWIRGNFFIPDPKIFWVKPSIKFLKEYLQKNPVDVIISTGTPHSMHLIAKKVSNEMSIPWIADFRDPWSKLDMLKSYNITSTNFKKYQKLELEVIKAADVCITTSEVWKNDFYQLGANKVECITNGYDETDFKAQTAPYKEFVVSHFGLLNHLRNPKNFWQALAELCKENDHFNDSLKIHLGGSIANENLKEIKEYQILKNKLVIFDYISHKEVVAEYSKSSILLLLLFNSESGVGNIPGKLFEYLASQKPIIGFGAGKGDSARIIEECNAGDYFEYQNNDIKEIKKVILKHYNNFKSGIKNEFPIIDKYNRMNLTGDLVRLLEDLKK
jgi:glycosyltransferase involved in cell wall biosynthesis